MNVIIPIYFLLHKVVLNAFETGNSTSRIHPFFVKSYLKCLTWDITQSLFVLNGRTTSEEHKGKTIVVLDPVFLCVSHYHV